jgi:hypothetical protein
MVQNTKKFKNPLQEALEEKQEKSINLGGSEFSITLPESGSKSPDKSIQILEKALKEGVFSDLEIKDE